MISGNVVVTGANRGLGLALVKQLVLVPEVQLVFATCRSPDEAKVLQDLAKENSKVKVVQLDVCSTESVENAVKIIRHQVGEMGLNLLINNAAILKRAPNLKLLTAEQMTEVYATNTVAPLMLIQAMLPLLETAVASNLKTEIGMKKAMVANISSVGGSLTSLPDLMAAFGEKVGNALPYCCSKAALNMITRCTAIEKPDILAVSIHPGYVATDMGGPEATLTAEQSASSIIKTLRNLKSEHTGGFFDWEGKVLPW